MKNCSESVPDPAAEGRYSAVVIGTSAGGLAALNRIITSLPDNYPLPLVVVQHMNANKAPKLAALIGKNSHLQVCEAEINSALLPGQVLVAPPNYHLLIEDCHMIALSTEPPYRFSRPSIDVTLLSAVRVFGRRLIGVILTGANDDGVEGSIALKQEGGYLIVQDPDNAEYPLMPGATIEAVTPDAILSIGQIASRLIKLGGGSE